ncbi:hypothetical protein NL292_26105, partial [Klebsiella pneumoniae]|nr:hypothetical protein [Klebsiella pneumoniae]
SPLGGARFCFSWPAKIQPTAEGEELDRRLRDKRRMDRRRVINDGGSARVTLRTGDDAPRD